MQGRVFICRINVFVTKSIGKKFFRQYLSAYKSIFEGILWILADVTEMSSCMVELVFLRLIFAVSTGASDVCKVSL